jgi:hypothetical protein
MTQHLNVTQLLARVAELETTDHDRRIQQDAMWLLMNAIFVLWAPPIVKSPHPYLIVLKCLSRLMAG